MAPMNPHHVHRPNVQEDGQDAPPATDAFLIGLFAMDKMIAETAAMS